MTTGPTILEDRLRAMFAAVATATVEDPPIGAVDASPDDWARPAALDVVDGHHRPARRPALAAALVIAVLAAAALLWSAARRPSEPASPMDGRTIAVPMRLPDGYGYVQAGVNQRDGLGTVFSPPTGEVALVIFRGPAGHTDGVLVDGYAEMVVASSADRTVTPNPDAEQVRLNSGVVAYLLPSPDLDRIEIGWQEVEGPSVMVRADHVSRTEIIDVANGMWYATRAEFDRLTAKAGFRTTDGPTWDIPGDGRVRAKVSGSLQQGLGVSVNEGDLPGGYSFVRVNPLCAAQYIAGVPEGTLEVLLFGPAGTASFVVRLPDGTEIGPIAAGTPPGLPNTRLGDATLAVRLDDMNRVSVRCDGARP